MNRILILALVILLSGCALYKSGHAPPVAFEGVWEGYGVQENHAPWAIKISIIGNQYLIDYPSLGCGGKLTLLSSSPDKLEMRENISYGLSICEDKGKTVLVKTGKNTALFRWYHPNGIMAATGSLAREEINYL